MESNVTENANKEHKETQLQCGNVLKEGTIDVQKYNTLFYVQQHIIFF